LKKIIVRAINIYIFVKEKPTTKKWFKMAFGENKSKKYLHKKISSFL